MTKGELFDLLISTRDQTLGYFDLEDNALDKTYGAGKWSIRQILHHLTDSELIFHERLKKIIAEPKHVVWACNQDQWNDAFDYKNEPLKNKKTVYEICRELNYGLIGKYYTQFCEKEFVHSEEGLRTLKLEFEKVALHNLNHIQQVQLALSK